MPLLASMPVNTYNNKEKQTLEGLKMLFASKGSELLNAHYKLVTEPLYFKCAHCGRKHYISYNNLLAGKNPNLLCERCFAGLTDFNNSDSYKTRRSPAENLWIQRIYRFFNVNWKIERNFAAHHIKPFNSNLDLRLSLTNGYPLRKTAHTFYNFPRDPSPDYPYLKPSNWPEDFFIEHNSNHLVNLGDILQTDFIYREDQIKSMKQRKENNSRYIPFFMDEIIPRRIFQISASLIRELIYPYYEDIYKYTQQPVEKISSGIIKEVPQKEADEFLRNNSLEYFRHVSVSLGLYQSKELVALANFERLNSPDNLWLELQCVKKLNTIIPNIEYFMLKKFSEILFPSGLFLIKNNRFLLSKPEEYTQFPLKLKYLGKTKEKEWYVDYNYNTRVEPTTLYGQRIQDPHVFRDLGYSVYQVL